MLIYFTELFVSLQNLSEKQLLFRKNVKRTKIRKKTMTNKRLSTEAIYRMQHPNSKKVWSEVANLLGVGVRTVKYTLVPENKPNGKLTATAVVETISHICNMNIEDVLETIETNE